MKRAYLLLLILFAVLAASYSFINTAPHANTSANSQQIALLFFFNRGLNQPNTWKAFFQSPESARLFNVYLYTEHEISDPWWKQKKIQRSVPYSENSHMLVWQALIQEALKNKRNIKFVVVTEDSVPLKTAREIFEYLSQNERSSMAYDNVPDDPLHFAKPYGCAAHELWKNKEWMALNRTHAKILSEDRAWVMRSHLRPYGQLYYPSTYLNLKGELQHIHNYSWTYYQEEEDDEVLLNNAMRTEALFASPISAYYPSEIITAQFTPPDVELEEEQAQSIGNRIWQRECRGSVEGLTHWNQGEEFPSCGIGHFIWFPKECQAPFQESFPGFIACLEAKGFALPVWLSSTTCCPWNTREKFYQAIASEKMQELRNLLLKTISEQTLFICGKLKGVFERIQAGLSGSEQRHLLTQYSRMLRHPHGVEALIDYMHFKGEGTSVSESYQGQGWGLKQVLLKMNSGSDKESLADFVAAAKEVLHARVQASPSERDEGRWLKGWYHRLDGY